MYIINNTTVGRLNFDLSVCLKFARDPCLFGRSKGVCRTDKLFDKSDMEATNQDRTMCGPVVCYLAGLKLSFRLTERLKMGFSAVESLSGQK